MELPAATSSAMTAGLFFYDLEIHTGSDAIVKRLIEGKVTLNQEKITLCKVRIGGFEERTKCLEDIPADIEITTDESSLRKINIFPYQPIPSSKESYAIVFERITNPKRSGLYQFHSYGQPKGQSVSSYLGSWTIVID